MEFVYNFIINTFLFIIFVAWGWEGVRVSFQQRVSIHLVDNKPFIYREGWLWPIWNTPIEDAEGQSGTIEFRTQTSIDNIIISTHFSLFKQYCLGSRQIFPRREKNLPRSRAVQKASIIINAILLFTIIHNMSRQHRQPLEPIKQLECRVIQNHHVTLFLLFL